MPRGGQNHIADYTIPGRGLAQRDVLVVIDDSAAMANYRERLASLPALVDATFGRLDRGLLDLRIAVTSNDGILRRTPSMTEPFLAMRTDFDLARSTNFSRTLADEVGALVDVGTAGTGPSKLLDAAALALANDGGFRRPNASLAVLFVGATDDESSRDPDEYAAQIQATVVSALVPDAAPRFDAFVADLAHAEGVGAAYSIDATDYAPAIDNLRTQFKTILPGMCLTAADVAPEVPGGQYDCTVTALVRDQELVLPPCGGDDDLVCWRLQPSQSCDADPDALELEVPVFWFYVSYPTIRMQCVVD
ncbi:MAG: hypothetical protein HOV81_40330 [Kofleriaceae bacterium]|nr:hypothetical protein [Kofleriaceae bacterium]